MVWACWSCCVYFVVFNTCCGHLLSSLVSRIDFPQSRLQFTMASLHPTRHTARISRTQDLNRQNSQNTHKSQLQIDCSYSTQAHHQQAQVLLSACQRLVRMETFESIHNIESFVYMMIDFRTICSLHNCHIEPCLIGLLSFSVHCCPKKDWKHVIFTCLVRML